MNIIRFQVIIFLILLSIFPVSSPADTPRGFHTVTHFSESLGRDATFMIYVPAEAGPDRRYPTLFVLHGAYGSYRDWPNASPVTEIADRYRMILVFPDGGEFGWYVDSPLDSGSSYESYIARELIPTVDHLFPTMGTRETRGIMGLSMGGHGAMTLAAKYPEMFSSASSMSGILNLTNHPGKWHIVDRLGPMEENKEHWIANAAWELAPAFQNSPRVRLLFDCGEEDMVTGAWQDSLEFHQRLNDLAIPHVWRPFSGGHTWEYWNARLPQHLNFHQASFMEHLEGENRAFTHYFNRLRAFHDEVAGRDRREDLPTLCLLGSSSAEGMADSLLPGFHVYNRGISSDILGIGGRGISHRMEESVFDIRPDIVVLKNGRNDLGDRARNGTPSLEKMIVQYRGIITTIRERLPETRIIVTTSFPTRGRFDHLAPAINDFNKDLTTLAAELDVTLIDLHPVLREEDSLLLREEYSADGLHLSQAGKEIWATAILEAINHQP